MWNQNGYTHEQVAKDQRIKYEVFMWADNLLDHVSLKDALGTDDEGLDRGGGEVGPAADARKSAVDKPFCFRDDGGHCDRDANRTAPKTFRKDFRDSWLRFNQAGRTLVCLEERMPYL